MFDMPTDTELARMSCDEIENKRIEAEKEANLILKDISVLNLERNEYKRKDLHLADLINKARVNHRDVKLAADKLKSLFFQKRI